MPLEHNPVMRVIFCSDTHLGFDHALHPRTPRRRRGEDFFANYMRVVDFALATLPDAFVHGGDVFTGPNVPAAVIDRFAAPLHELACRGVTVAITPGNHDRSTLPASIWLAHDNIHVFTSPGHVRIDRGGSSLAVHGFPFARRIGQHFGDLLAATGWHDGEPADARLLLMHQSVEGAIAGAHEYRFPAGPDVIPADAIPPDASVVLSGHMHRQQLTCAGPGRGVPVWYSGSVERTSFAERNERKGFLELELGTTTFPAGNAVEPRPGRECRSPGPTGPPGRQPTPIHVTRHELPARPMFDLAIRGHSPADVHAAVAAEVRQLPLDAVVRVRWDDGDGGLAAEMMHARELRPLFPPSMSIELPRPRSLPRRTRRRATGSR